MKIQNLSSLLNRIQPLWVLVFSYIFVLLFFTQRNFLLFRDYSILWEAAFRVSLGQIPYTDFGSPVGPISFLLPALFFKIFSPTWEILQITQLVENIFIIFLVYGITVRLECPRKIINFTIVLCAIFYLVFLTHPWYNSTAAIFFLAAIWSILKPGIPWVILSSLFAGICFITKQDYGIVAGGIVSVLIIAQYITHSKSHPKIISFTFKHHINDYFILFGQLLIFSILFFLPLVILLQVVHVESFLYWFNYGQTPHTLRKIYIWNFVSRGNILISAFVGTYIFLKTRRFDSLVASLILYSGFVVSSTSGLDFTSFYYLLSLPLLVGILWNLSIKHKIVKYILLIGLLLSLATPIKYLYRLVETTVISKPEPFSFRARYVTRPVAYFPESAPFFTNVMGSIDSIEMISELKNQLKEYLIPYNGSQFSPLTMFLMGEMTPLFAELNIKPPTNVPLWFHTKISFFPREIDILRKEFVQTKYDIVILQNAHGQANFEEFLNILQRNPNYESMRDRGYVSPTTSTGDPCYEGYCPNHIYVYVRRSLLK
jgi:hypothetical protein